LALSFEHIQGTRWAAGVLKLGEKKWTQGLILIKDLVSTEYLFLWAIFNLIQTKSVRTTSRSAEAKLYIQNVMEV
jgi:hypothetical protein